MKKTAATPPAPTHRINHRFLLLFIVLALLLYVVLPQLGSFSSSFSQLGGANLGWVLAAGGSFLGSVAAGAVVYKLLAPKKLPYGRTAAVLLAASFAGRLLPAGLGALGVGYQYLRRQKISQPDALAVVTLNNFLGFVGNMLLLVVLLMVLPSGLSLLHWPHVAASAPLVVAGLVLIVIASFLVQHFAGRLRRLVRHTFKQLAAYKHRPGTLVAAFVSSICLTACYALCLWASCLALGIHISAAQALLVLTVGVAAGTVVPSPGGLGGAEAGLVAALVAYRVPAHSALAAAFLYRLLTYWLGLALGAAAFVYMSRRRYI